MASENPRVWFKSISLENIRSFGSKQTINFTDKTGNAARWNVILGDNGTGKTTVLKALVIMVQNQQAIYETGVDLTELWRSNKEGVGVVVNGEIEQDRQTLETGFIISQLGNLAGSYFRFTRDYEIEMPLFAYNAARQISVSAISDKKSNSITNFFSERNELTNAEEWLVQSEYIALKEPQFKSRYTIVLNILKSLFRTEVSEIYINTSTGQPKVFFKTPYGDVRLHQLSLGYKTLIAWMVDFAKGLLDRYPDSENPLAEPAVCLVDEIDLHLHPKFQRNIITFLTETFTNTQFIVTAHSPLIVQSAEDANIILLQRIGNETHIADGIDVHSWRLDQILSSDLFGGISIRPPDTERKLQRRRSLLLKNKRTKSEIEELEQLEEELGQLTASESKESIKALELIGKALSK